MRLALVLSLLLPTVAIAAEPSYVGRWADKQVQCKAVSGDTEGPVIFTAKGMDAYEDDCTFTSVTEAPEGWRIQATCKAEGDVTKETWLLSVSLGSLNPSDPIALTLIRSGLYSSGYDKGKPFRYTTTFAHRCAAKRQASTLGHTH